MADPDSAEASTDFLTGAPSRNGNGRDSDPFRGDTLALILCMQPARELLRVHALVSRAFWAAVRCSPLAWPHHADLAFCRLGQRAGAGQAAPDELHPIARYPLGLVRSVTSSADWLPHLAALTPRATGLVLVETGAPAGPFAAQAQLRWLRTLPLQSLSLSGVVSSAALAHVASRPLTSLRITGIFGERELQALSALHGLKSLWLNCFTGDAGLEHLSELPLTSLSLTHCFRVRGPGLAFLRALPLRALDLQYTSVTDDALSLIASLPLVSLNVSFCPELTGAGLACLSSIPTLRVLRMAGSRFNDEALALVGSLPVELLDVCSTRLLTDFGLTHLKRMPLRRLEAADCPWLTEAGVEYLTTRMPYVRLVTDNGSTATSVA
jgi:hypothetical protein